MEVSKQKESQFEILSIAEVSASSSDTSFCKSEPVCARFGSGSGFSKLRFGQESETSADIAFDLRISQACI